MQKTVITAKDDNFHFDEMSDRWWETETSWFSFHNAERKLGGWLYVFTRPNVGAVAGGCWVWDDTAHLPWEVLYNANYTTLRLPKAQNLTDITFPTGVSIKMLEPLQRYQLGFEDGDRIKVSLVFDAVMPPAPLAGKGSGFGNLGHFDQIGHVTGELVLKGERIAIDCLSMRDRSWGPRPEHRPQHTAYVTGIVDRGHGFLANTHTGQPGEPVKHGFLLRDGVTSPLVSGSRSVERNLQHGWMERIVIEGVDERGRTLHAVGEAVSHIFINRHSFVDCNSLVRWQVDGQEGWGEDQDCCPVHTWADMRAEMRATLRRGA